MTAMDERDRAQRRLRRLGVWHRAFVAIYRTSGAVAAVVAVVLTMRAIGTGTDFLDASALYLTAFFVPLGAMVLAVLVDRAEIQPRIIRLVLALSPAQALAVGPRSGRLLWWHHTLMRTLVLLFLSFLVLVPLSRYTGRWGVPEEAVGYAFVLWWVLVMVTFAADVVIVRRMNRPLVSLATAVDDLEPPGGDPAR
jgi:hypothetical protein